MLKVLPFLSLEGLLLLPNLLIFKQLKVPLSMGIRVASLRGTLRLQIKAPPSDQLWFGFTSMPDIDLNLESSVGDHKIANGHIALFLINRFKVWSFHSSHLIFLFSSILSLFNMQGS